MAARFALLAIVAPLVFLLWLAVDSPRNVELIVPNEHFYIVTLVSLLAAIVALLVARAAVQLHQYQPLLVALGFMTMAGFFAVHALHTPGVMFGKSGYVYDGASGAAGPIDYSGTVVGLSGFLSVFLASFFFAASHPTIAERVRQRISARALAGLVLLGVIGYIALSAWQAEWLASLPLSKPPFAYGVVGGGVLMLLVAAWFQVDIYRRARRPFEGALAVAYVFLAEAQAMMLLTPWSTMWWGYHVLMLAAVILALSSLIVELERRRGLERFLPIEVVERVVAGDLLHQSGERRVVTVLFADLRDSTAMAEGLPAERVVEMLNESVGVMARAVFDHKGMLDKFLGDGVMALFGILEGTDNGAEAAVGAALQMREEARRGAAGSGQRITVGIHTGEVVLGAVGIPRRFDFTAIGDAVNTAARIQGELTKQLGVDIVLSRPTVDLLPAGVYRLRDLGAAAVRGRREAVEVFTLE